MRYTVRLCRDASGWFATMRTPPTELVRRTVSVQSPALAYRVLDVTQALARRLDRREDARRLARLIDRTPLLE